jgi:hypothetical protein
MASSPLRPRASSLVGVAYRAVSYTKNKIPHRWNRSSDVARMVAENKAANPDEAKAKIVEDANKRRKEMRAESNTKLLPTVKPGTGYTVFGHTFFAEIEPPECLDWDDRIMYDGKLAEEHQTGACGDMAAVAYRFLRNQRVPGLHYILMGHNKKVVHSFVVIGINSKVPEGMSIDQTLGVKGFGNDAIICDPWLGDTGGVFLVGNEWEAAVGQMIEEVIPDWNGSDPIQFSVLARSSALTREQKVEMWKAKQT